MRTMSPFDNAYLLWLASLAEQTTREQLTREQKSHKLLLVLSVSIGGFINTLGDILTFTFNQTLEKSVQ
jgi:hypothetical protein